MALSKGFWMLLKFPYTGSGVLASALAMNKVMTKRVLSTTDVPTPAYLAVDSEADLMEQCDEAVDRLGLPLVIKPTSEGSSIGVSIVKEKPELERIAYKTQFEFGEIFFEQYIGGQEITVGLLGMKENLRALPVLELVPKREFYDYEAKYTEGMTEFILPARLSDQLTRRGARNRCQDTQSNRMLGRFKGGYVGRYGWGAVRNGTKHASRPDRVERPSGASGGSRNLL